jgi:chromate reductase, NAD(P)H dehydrogenase (quinone)
MINPRILAFAGSARKESFNKKLIRIAGEGARRAGGDVTLIDLADFPLPLFDQDLEAQGFPGNAKKLKELFLSHQGLLLSCPEYNSSMTPLLKNTLDWVSRLLPGEKPLACFAGKVAGLVSASPGALGGLRGLVPVRAMLGNIQVLVIPEQAAVSGAHEAFQVNGSLKDAKLQTMVENVGAGVVKLLTKF